jgi:hypothetical protein
MVPTKGIWASLSAVVADALRWAAGPSQVKLDSSYRDHVASVTAVSVHGFELTIQCNATYFVREFERAFMPKRRMAVYRISTTVPPDAPPRLQDIAGNFTATIPRDCAYFLGETHQKQRAIEAYLDLLLAKLDRRQSELLAW